MPELPEVEVVRRGLAQWVVGREIAEAEVLHPRAVRRHLAGADDLAARLKGRVIESARRRGKYLWLPLSGPDEALMAHLGMSGQLLVVDPAAPPEKHLRVRVRFADGGPDLRFVDQRTFGHVMLAPLVGGVPEPIAHIAPDPFEPAFDEAEFARRLRARHTEIKRALLDQSLISGVGNIYADEALWIARLHWARPTETLTRPKIAELVSAVREVMAAALHQGGTSFDSLYVNVNGESGYFDRSLEVYGRRDLPCSRCGSPIRREPFMNRSSYSCPRCQRRPR
ncbi:bifunctional DNA-formamidopyrimidine glycosylase/DNA-(apurinic or apyrimidinic site) lyase [Nonomuraea pusilla]|uniref:Formamidopyrimidine-DNA glycosylase n=1 Tax=Nonomuraea pusilla TaxID=46177 RepID=A0A1H8AKL5_9ACTN|nr:bifunctional DNA-formamidopyrimidine glycosylase/DNA-(apurinic or apyrimidinic site) lyase [Nonomuraea pusilla]SEM71280.1 DNA-(apurinic or apyrimidinic site) lyase [Nonomuraea pusilla]